MQTHHLSLNHVYGMAHDGAQGARKGSTRQKWHDAHEITCNALSLAECLREVEESWKANGLVEAVFKERGGSSREHPVNTIRHENLSRRR